VVWVRIGGLAVLVAGALALLLFPMWGRYIGPAAVALIIVGTAALATGTRYRHSRHSASGAEFTEMHRV
jgi:hypothetical protein